MIYFEVQNGTGKVVAGNMQDFLWRDRFKGEKNFCTKIEGKKIKGIEETFERDDTSVWVVIEDEDDLFNSSKLFKKTIRLYKRVALDVWEHHKMQLDAHAHTLTTIQGQIGQKIEGFAKDEQFHGETYSESAKNISDLVMEKKESAADLICYTYKRISDMRAHLLGVEVIHFGTRYEIKPTSVSLKRAILNQCTPFLEELEKKSVKMRFFFDAECEVEVDKNMFSLVMYNFFSNAVKYTKRNSEIRLNYSEISKSLDISMQSLKMEKDEINNLFRETVRGKHAANISGKGIGLFVLQRALHLMRKKSMYIDPTRILSSLCRGRPKPPQPAYTAPVCKDAL